MKEFNSSSSKLLNRISHYQNFAFLLLLTIPVVGLYHQVLRGWWTNDDPAILKNAVQYNPWEYFFIPHVWQQITVNNLTPLIFLSFDIDTALFGLEPLWFYAHQLIILWLVVVMLYFVLLLYVPPLFAAIGTGLFVVGTPVVTVVTELMSRHYLEGLVLALIAMYLFVKALRTKRTALAWISGLFYILAMTAKEVYVPLVVAVMVLPENTWRIRFKYATPLLLAILFYIPWRMWMLGEAVGGYGSIVKAQDLLLLPQKILQLLFDCNTLWGAFSAFIALGIIFGMSWRRRSAFLYTICISVFVLTPVVPLAHGPMSHRYVFVIWTTLCIGISIGLFRFWKKTWLRNFVVFVMWFIIFLSTVISRNHKMADHVKKMDRWRAEGSFVLEEAGHKKYLIETVGPSWFYESLTWLRKEFFKRPEGPSVVYDNIFFMNHDIDEQTVWTYSTEGRKIINANDSITDIVTKIKGRIRKEAPLSIRVSQEGRRVSWQLGPYHDGVYFALMGEGLYPYHILREDTRKLGPNFKLKLQFRYDSPEGWTTYSPSFIISPETCPIVWKR